MFFRDLTCDFKRKTLRAIPARSLRVTLRNRPIGELDLALLLVTVPSTLVTFLVRAGGRLCEEKPEWTACA
uniref:Uncharacterized protein n=1 Tax=Steinernema glaseri TaxID=37863 RepID=A0A1I7YPN2_9BILA